VESAKIRSAGVAVQRIHRARWAAWLAFALLGLYFSSPTPPPAHKTLPGEVEIDTDALVLHPGDHLAEADIERATRCQP
jgi:hypothetical protein